jgi:hypothetical protein
MSFTSSLPTKLPIIAGVRLPKAWSVSITDSVRVYELRASKSFVFGTELLDTSKSVDVLFRTLGKYFTEYVRAVDTLYRFKTYTVVLKDYFIDEGLITALKVRELRDSVRAADILSKYSSFIRTLPEQVITSDILTKLPTKKLVDQVRTSDYVSKLGIKKLVDSCRGVDTLSRIAYHITKLIDTSKLTDRLVKLEVKLLTDSVINVDKLVKLPYKGLIDTSKLVDTLSKLTVKNLIDLSKTSDYISKLGIKKLVDYSRTTDLLVKLTTKKLLDLGKPVDTFIITSRFVRMFADVGRSSDILIKLLVKRLTDSYRVTDVLYRVAYFIRSFTDSSRLVDILSKSLRMNVYDYMVGEYSLIPSKVRVVSVTDSFLATDLLYIFKRLTITVSDVIKSLDVLVPSVYKVLLLTDTYRVADLMFKDLGITLKDYFIDEGYASKGLSRPLLDITKSLDALATALHRVLTLVDVTKSSDLVIPALHRVLSLLDTYRVADWLFRGNIVSLKDTLVDEGYITKYIVSNYIDASRIWDVVAKVAYTIAGLQGRRVYTFPKDLKALVDLILPEDHNVKVDACKNILDRFKRVRDKLGVYTEDVNSMISKLEEYVNKMVYVKYGDEYKAEYVNLFMDYCWTATSLLHNIYDTFESKTGKSLTDVKVIMALADVITWKFRFVWSGFTILPEDHNLVIDCLKCIEVALQLIEKEL